MRPNLGEWVQSPSARTVSNSMYVTVGSHSRSAAPRCTTTVSGTQLEKFHLVEASFASVCSHSCGIVGPKLNMVLETPCRQSGGGKPVHHNVCHMRGNERGSTQWV